MEKIAFMPHKTRGKEIVRILEGMGGKNTVGHDGSTSRNGVSYHVNDYGYIVASLTSFLKKKGYEVYTLEEWENKYSCLTVNETTAMTPKYNKITLYEDLCSDKVEITLNGYDIIQEGGKWFAVKKKKEYPKTYEECCEIMEDVADCSLSCFACGLLNNLQKLLLCRDAYWKIAGEEMGLDGPWEPTNNKYSYIITRCCNEIATYRTAGNSVVFEFPTEEMRDAFKKNFDKDLEFCKGLL